MTLHVAYTSRPASLSPYVAPAHTGRIVLFTKLVKMGVSISYARAIARAA